MDSLLFSLNATVPVFLMILLGMLFRRLGWMDRAMAEKVNRFVFQVPLPVMLFGQMAEMDMAQAWEGRFVLFCFAVTLLSVAIGWVLCRRWKDRPARGEFIHCCYRSNVALLGVALLQNIYGDVQMAPAMLIASVPTYNVMAVVILSLFRTEGGGMDAATAKKTLRSIVTNPILVGVAAGVVWSLLGLPMPGVLDKTVSNLGSIASPLGLIAVGAIFDGKKTAGRLGATLGATAVKLVGLCALFLPLAAALGFRDQQLVAILLMLGSSTAVSSYAMTRAMGYEGVITAGTLMLTTLLSGFTLTLWLWLLRAMGLI